MATGLIIVRVRTEKDLFALGILPKFGNDTVRDTRSDSRLVHGYVVRELDAQARHRRLQTIQRLPQTHVTN